MSSACHCCETPPGYLCEWVRNDNTRGGYAEGTDTTKAAAIAAAVADIPGYYGYVSGTSPQISAGIFSRTASPYYGAGASRSKYRLAFLSPTCYFKAWWDEVDNYYDCANIEVGFAATTFNRSVVRNSVVYEFSPISVNGLCLPALAGLTTSPLTWNLSDERRLESAEPDSVVLGHNYGATVETIITNLRFSFVLGYTPPSGGSANGFPP